MIKQYGPCKQYSLFFILYCLRCFTSKPGLITASVSGILLAWLVAQTKGTPVPASNKMTIGNVIFLILPA